MVIAIAINKSWNIFNFRQGIVTTLIDAGHTVIAIAPRDEYVQRLESLGCICEHLPLTDTGSNPLHELRAVFAFHRIINRHKIDVLLTYTIKCNLYGALAASWNKVPCICNISGLGTAFLADGVSAAIARFLSKKWLGKASHLFFQNDDDRQDFMKLTGLDKCSNSLLPGSGIDVQKFKMDQSVLPNKYQFLLLARLIIEKGVNEYAMAAAKVKASFPESKFLIVGGLDEAHARSIKQKDLDHWVAQGWVTHVPHTDHIMEMISQSEVVVLPSYREGTPRSLLEGAACRRPLITTDVPGCREVVADHVNGFLCQPRSAEELAEKCIQYLTSDSETKKKLGVESRRLVEERFDEQKVIQAYLDKISELT